MPSNVKAHMSLILYDLPGILPSLLTNHDSRELLPHRKRNYEFLFDRFIISRQQKESQSLVLQKMDRLSLFLQQYWKKIAKLNKPPIPVMRDITSPEIAPCMDSLFIKDVFQIF